MKLINYLFASFRVVSAFILMTLVCLPENAQAQQKTITVSGVVVDEYGDPMPGVMVFDPAEKKYGTMSGNDGRYAIVCSKDVSEICFSFMGYKDKLMAPKDAALVKMEPSSQMLEETVVTGIYERKAESFTGSAKSISSEELKRAGNQNVFESLKNMEPSLMILDNLEQGSNPNALANMQLRGASSFGLGTTDLKSNFVNNSNMPLFILDGFETTAEKVQDMDMNRIQSITILKDASAKAIYGAKAGNGVIVLETKALRSEKPLVSYIGSVDVELPDLSSYNLCNALEKLEIERREHYYERISTDTESLVENMALYNERLKRAMEGESTYWLSKPLRAGVGHKHSLSVELGSKSLKTLTTFSYNKTAGVMKGSSREVISGDVNMSYRLKNWTFRNIMSIASMRSNESPYGSFDTYAKLNPYDSPYDSEGNLLKLLSPVNQYQVGNPLYDAQLNSKNTSGYLDFTDNIHVELRMFPFLKLVGRFGISTKRTTNEEFYPADHSRFLSNTTSEDERLRRGSYDMTNGSSTVLSGDVSAQFNKNFNKKHDLFATAQYSISSMKYSEVTHYTEGFPNSRMDNIIFARQYAMDSTPSGTDGLNRNLGFLLTAGYGYRDRYMLDATVKTSASSVFGTDNKWGLFWSTGLAWNLHNEPFMKNTKSWLHQCKFRFSMGSSGNQNYSTNNSLPIYSYYNNSYYDGFTGVSLDNMENPGLGWEQKMDYNLGLDFRTKYVDLTMDAYLADTKNLVFNRSILPSTGFTSVNDNLGKVRNKGIEASINVRVFQRGASYIGLFGKMAFNDNRILEISDALRNFNREQQEHAMKAQSDAPVIQYYDNMPLNSIWAVRSLGIDPVSGKEIFVDKNGNMTNKWNAADLVNCGSSDPLYNGNFGLNGEVKGFGLNVVFRFQGGGYRYNTTLVNKVENVYIGYNVDRRIFTGRWFEPGQEAQFKDGYTHDITQPTTRFVQKSNLLGFSTVSLYYEFPYKIIRKLRMQRLRLTLFANDLATFSSIAIERGTSYPYAKSFSFSLTASF